MIAAASTSLSPARGTPNKDLCRSSGAAIPHHSRAAPCLATMLSEPRRLRGSVTSEASLKSAAARCLGNPPLSEVELCPLTRHRPQVRHVTHTHTRNYLPPAFSSRSVSATRTVATRPAARSARMPMRDAPCTQPPATPSVLKTRSASPRLHHCTLHLQRSFLSKRFSGKHILRLRAHVSLGPSLGRFCGACQPELQGLAFVRAFCTTVLCKVTNGTACVHAERTRARMQFHWRTRARTCSSIGHVLGRWNRAGAFALGSWITSSHVISRSTI